MLRAIKLNPISETKDASNIDFLNEMVNCYNNNKNKPTSAYRYSENSKHFASYMRMIGGCLNYETFHANNFGAVPSISARDNFIRKRKSVFIEGAVRVKELLHLFIYLFIP